MWIYEKMRTPRLRAAANSEQVWPEVLSVHLLDILWCSLRQTLRKKCLTKPPVVYNHYDRTAKSCGPLLLQDNARKDTTYFCAQNFHVFSPLPVLVQHVYKRFAFCLSSEPLTCSKLFRDIEEVKNCLKHYCTKQDVGFILFQFAQT